MNKVEAQMPLRFKKPKFRKTINHFKSLEDAKFDAALRKGGQMGIRALAAATPIDTGEASRGWSFKVTGKNGLYKLIWYNSKMAGNVPVVILLQYGHGTGTGGYFPGVDFINPALRPVYEYIKEELAAEVMR